MLWKVSAVQLHTLVALIEAGPTTTHTELFNKMINNNVKEYAKVGFDLSGIGWFSAKATSQF